MTANENVKNKETMLLEKLSKHVNQLMANERLTASELGRRIDLPASTIKKIRNCDAPNPTVATLLPIASYFSLTLSQLVGDENMPFSGSHGGLQKIPVLTWQSALNYASPDVEISQTISLAPPESPHTYALIVEDQSFENFPQGTILIVNPDIQPKHNDYVVVCKNGQPSSCLKQWIDNQGDIYLKPMITGCPLTTLTTEFRVLGVIIEYRKRLVSR